MPRMLIVTVQHANPYYDDSYAVNSANIGPYGDAIVKELYPLVEQNSAPSPSLGRGCSGADLLAVGKRWRSRCFIRTSTTAHGVTALTRSIFAPIC